MDPQSDGSVQISVDGLEVFAGLMWSPAPDLYRPHAELAEHFEADDDREGSGFFFVAVREENGGAWPGLVVTQSFAPSTAGFTPGVLVVPGQRQVFIGAGTRLLAYQRRSGHWRRNWVDEAVLGFWGWRRHDDVVLMSAELELAAWTITGDKLWTAFVEPPWSYEVAAGRVILDVMGEARAFDLRRGPPTPSR